MLHKPIATEAIELSFRIRPETFDLLSRDLLPKAERSQPIPSYRLAQLPPRTPPMNFYIGTFSAAVTPVNLQPLLTSLREDGWQIGDLRLRYKADWDDNPTRYKLKLRISPDITPDERAPELLQSEVLATSWAVRVQAFGTTSKITCNGRALQRPRYHLYWNSSSIRLN